MNEEKGQILKKKVTVDTIDVHPTEKALVVNYEVEAVILSEFGAPVLGDKKACQKIIKMNLLDEKKNIKQMAKDIIEKYKIIHPSKVAEVEQLLYYLQKRKETNSSLKLVQSQKEKDKLNIGIDSFGKDEKKETANINDLESYLEMMYDKSEEKIRGTSLILQLARNSENLEELCQNEILLGALARVLAEEWKENINLATNIIYIFFCFSSYTQLHSVVAHFQIGSLCMKIIEHELKRYEAWKEKKGITKDGATKKSSKQLQNLASKQEQLLRVAFYLLMNLAEDTKVEAKMHKKGIVSLLIKVLDRSHNPELLILVVSFLKKLSIFIENKDLMAADNIISHLQAVLTASSNQDLTNITLRLLLNLSFDTNLRLQMNTAEMLQNICSFLTTSTREDDRLVATCLLYHISMEASARTHMSSIVSLLIKTVLSATRETPQVEALALLVNLSNDATCAAVMADLRTISQLFKHAFKGRDPLVAKFLKNILKHTQLPQINNEPSKDKNAKNNKEKKSNSKHHRAYMNHIGELADEAKDAFRDDFSAECLAMLAYLPEVDYSVLLHEYSMADWLGDQLAVLVTMNNKDVHDQQLAAELVLLIGSACVDEASASMLFNNRLISNLINFLKIKQEDDYMVLLIVTTFHRLLQHSNIRGGIINNTEVPAYLIDLIHDNNPHVRKLCASALEVVGEENDEWRTRVQSEKFKCHNQHWLEMVDNQTSQPLEDHLLTFNLDNNLDQHLLLSRQFYHDQVAAANDFDGNDSYLGGFIEDAEALDHTDFYYGDEGYKRPPSVAGFNRDSLTYNNSFSSYHLEDYDADLLLNNSYSFGNN